MDQLPSCNFLECRVEQGVLVVSLLLNNIQDEQIAQAVENELHAVAGAIAGKRIVIDFDRVKYLSSVAFKPLLSLRRRLQSEKGRLILCNLNGVVYDVFRTTRLVDPLGETAAPFELESNIAAAIARLVNTAPPEPA